MWGREPLTLVHGDSHLDLGLQLFEFDILACPDCGGRLRLVGTIAQPGVFEKILTHLGLPAELPSPAPAHSTEWLPGWPVRALSKIRPLLTVGRR